MAIEKGSKEWYMMADLYKLYDYSLPAKDDDRWNETMCSACSEFIKKYVDELPIAQELAWVLLDDVLRKQGERREKANKQV